LAFWFHTSVAAASSYSSFSDTSVNIDRGVDDSPSISGSGSLTSSNAHSSGMTNRFRNPRFIIIGECQPLARPFDYSVTL
jgi:hypothetical protein